MAMTADSLRIRITTSFHDSRANVQQPVESRILTDDKILMRVVARVFVYVMYMYAARNRLPECPLSNVDVLRATVR